MEPEKDHYKEWIDKIYWKSANKVVNAFVIYFIIVGLLTVLMILTCG